MEELLLNPNVAYLLLVSGFMLAILALLSPGTGLLEVGSLFVLVLAGWGVYNSEINLWALGLLLLGVFPFLLAVRKSGQMWLLAISVLALVVGSAFLFRGEGWQPAVHPVLAGMVSILSAGFIWVMARKTLEAEFSQPTHDLGLLISQTGEAKSHIHLEGTVQVAGELWTARSAQTIQSGAMIRVIDREGLILVVEPLETPSEPRLPSAEGPANSSRTTPSPS